MATAADGPGDNESHRTALTDGDVLVVKRGLCSGGCLESAHALQQPHMTQETDLYPADEMRWTCGHAHPSLCKACYDSPTCPVDGHAHPRTSVKFRLLTWNIDGLDTRNPILRTSAVCHFIKAKCPHAVFLQEVIPLTMRIIIKELESLYDIYSPPAPSMDYFAALLTHKTQVKARGALDCFDFPSSSMGRHLLHLPISFAGANIDLFTSHLESTKSEGEERTRQLKTAFDRIRCKCDEDVETCCLFGGDLNLRDSEVKKAVMPQGMVDVWEANGSPATKKFTWDISENDNLDWPHPNKPKCRFDRIYLMSGPQGSLKVAPPTISTGVSDKDDTTFELVGKVRLRKCGGRFPSDHWGIWAEFIVEYPEKVSLTHSTSKSSE